MKYSGIIEDQKFVEEFNFNDKTYYKYLIKFNGYQELFTINRCETLEQALIGATLMYDLDPKYEFSIKKYKIISFEKPKYVLIEKEKYEKFLQLYLHIKFDKQFTEIKEIFNL